MNGTDQQLKTAGGRRLKTFADLDDKEAFEAIVRGHGPRLYRYTRRRLANEFDVADVVQATFVGAWRQLSSYRGDASLGNWLFAICANKITDTYRASRAQASDEILLTMPSLDGGCDPFIVVSNVTFLAELQTALAELPARQHASWVLREVESRTFAEIGEALGTSPDAARGHHCRATAALRIRMEPWR